MALFSAKQLSIISSMILLHNSFAQTTSIVSEDFDLDKLVGTWRIDSVAENSNMNKRAAVNEEFFVFQEGGTVKMKAIEDDTENIFTLGTYRVVNDTLKITTLKGAEGMNFKIFLKGDFIQLDGTFPISEYNQAKPTLFLGRRKVD
jgi:hypothetical protein